MTVNGASPFGQPSVLILEPYVTPGSFTTAPTYMDVDDLVPGGLPGAQAAELLNVLLRASAWCDVITGGAENPYLGAHLTTEQFRSRMRRDGTLSLHPKHAPARQVLALSVGTDPTMLNPQDVTKLWLEDDRQIIVPSTLNAFLPQLSGTAFGNAAYPTYVQLSYVAGWTNTTLSAPAAAGASSVTVYNPAGLNPGDSIRIQTPGLEEFVVVASTYTPGVTLNTAVPLVSALLNNHAAGDGFTALPMNIQQACICYGVGLLLREDVTYEEPFAETSMGPSARMSMSGGVAGGLIEEAVRLLQPYARVR